jgi:RND family efflux transporter MFP subunit
MLSVNKQTHQHIVTKASLKERFELVAALVAGIVLSGCDSEATLQSPEPLPVALVATAKPAAAPEFIVTGRVIGRNEMVVSSETGGRVMRIDARVGDVVRRGQVLAVLDSALAERQSEAAAASVARAQRAAEERTAHLVRTRGLLEAGVAAQADLETAVADEAAARATLAEARAALAAAQRAARETTLRALADGIVSARHIALSQMLAPGAPAFEIDGEGPREIEAMAPSVAVAGLNHGSEVRFVAGGEVGAARYAGAAARSSAGGARLSRFVIESGKPAPGSAVELHVAAKGVAKALIPLPAVLNDRSGVRRVLVVGAGDMLRAETVELASVSAAGALVRGEIAPGDRVVAAGGEFLTPGAKVRPIHTNR